MPKFFDPIMQSKTDIDLDGGTILYLIRVGDDYGIKGLSSDDLIKVGSDPHTLAKQYWPISDIAAFMANVDRESLGALIFPKGELTSTMLTLTVLQSLGLHPDTEPPVFFSEAIRKQLQDEADNDKLTAEALTGMIQDYFYQRITRANHQDLWDAWDELRESRSVCSKKSSAVIAKLNITPAAKTLFVDQLTQELFSFNTQNMAYIESQFSLNKRYPTHFERFAVQVNFEDLLIQAAIDHSQANEDDNERSTDVSQPDENFSDDAVSSIGMSDESEKNEQNSEQSDVVEQESASDAHRGRYRGRLFSEVDPAIITMIPRAVVLKR